MKLLRYIVIIALAAIFSACQDDITPLTQADMPLVIEGWIEDGGYPVVMVTRAANLQDEIESFDGFVEKWCRVTVSDGEHTEILSGRIDHRYTPPFIYTTTKLRGEIGGTYHLKVETETETVEADATIRPYARIISAKVVPCAGDESLRRIEVRIDAIPGEYYKFFTRVRPDEERFYSSFLGTFSGVDYDRSAGFDVMRGIHSTYSDTFTPYYRPGDVVNIKLCTLEPEAYAFWRAYENAVSLSTNMFFSSTEGCPSTIPGAKGYWCGYGYSGVTVIVE